jgi:hypothetical protein
MAMVAHTRPLDKDDYRRERGESYGTPKEIWGFRTRAVRSVDPARIAREFLAANCALLRITNDLRGVQFRRRLDSVGAHHVVFQQVHGPFRVHRAYATVHMDRACRVYLLKNRLVPARLLVRAKTFDVRISRADAIARAKRALPHPERPSRAAVTDQLWFPDEQRLEPAWKVRLVRTRPREEWIVYVNARTHGILSKCDNLADARAAALGMAFYPNPVIALGSHAGLLSAKERPRRPPLEAYRIVALDGLAGATLDGPRVSTRPTAARVRRADGRFMFEAHERGFGEVMAYFHIDAAVRYLERLGFRGPRGFLQLPVRVDVGGTTEDNSWYSPIDRSLTFGTGWIDDAQDAETILHEFGHAIQDAICPDFGQTYEARAMGEGFGDYFAAAYFAPVKQPAYRACVMSWDGLLLGLDAGSKPPCLRRVDEPVRFDDYDGRRDEHDNGKIWSATLWDVHNALGRDTAMRVIVESHYQLDGFTRMRRGARAIIDADRNLEDGRHERELRGIFRKRRIGPL